MEKLNILGTGHAMTLDCYNTCFTLENNEGEHILVDTGGGLQIIKQLLRDEVENADWLLHEAMCMDSEADIFKPYEKMHSTVKTASKIAMSLNVKNLALYHASDNDLENRKRLYTEEAKQYFNGNIYVPDDLDVIEL